MRKILIPIDEKQSGEAQIEFLLKHELPEDAEITLLTVVRTFALQDYGYNVQRAYFDLIIQEDTRLANILQDEMEKLLRTRFANTKLIRSIKTGAPVKEILKHARENGVDWIIMGAHGRAGLDKLFLGSVSQSVVNQAACSVTIVRIPINVEGPEKKAELMAPAR